MWWENAVIYQVYLRSFQDSDGDGVGDLPGVTSRLEHIAKLGADAVWLSPVYPSPNADFGYDVSDFNSVDPTFGTLADLDALIARAHELGLRVLLDFVPCHTSTEHPWFREHPEYYVWADEPANNWRAAFGGRAWGLDPVTGRYYLHSFFPEQADLDWRNPDVREAMADALRFWVNRGVDGFRLDALDRLMKDPELRDDPPATGPAALPMDPADAALEHLYSRNSPDVGVALRAIREAVGEALLVGEVYLPTSELGPYLGVLDVVFSFETLHAGADAARLTAAIESGLNTPGIGWVLSNHDFSRLATRSGPANARALSLLLLTLPGTAFLFQGDELGMANGTPAGPPHDRNGRDAFRMPMRWDESAHAGFTTGQPWLTSEDEPVPSVAEQERDPSSTLALVRAAIAKRRELDAEAEVLDAPPGTVVVARRENVLAVNLGATRAPAPPADRLELEANPGDGDDLGVLPAHAGWIARRDR
jgi:alpha-glucosidase